MQPFIITGVFWTWFSVSMHFRGKTDCSIRIFLCFCHVQIFRSIYSSVKELSSFVLFLIVSMSLFLLKHWFWSISMSLVSKLLHPGVSIWIINSNLLASQINFVLLFEILFRILFQDLELFFLIALCDDF